MPLAYQINDEQAQLDHLKKENERLKRHLLEVDHQWEESLQELKAENDFLREENATLKKLMANNTEAERLTLAMAEMERGYEKQIQTLQAFLQKAKHETQHKVIRENKTSDDMIEKSIVRVLLQVLLHQDRRADAKEQALKVLCESVGILSAPHSNTSPRANKDNEDLEKVGLSDLWIAYLMQKSK